MASLLVPGVGGALAFRFQPASPSRGGPNGRLRGLGPPPSRLRCNAQAPAPDGGPVAEPGSSGPGAGVSAEAQGSRAAAAVEAIRSRGQGFWETTKERHVVYRQDREQWGLGFEPIFTVYEDAQGNRYRVDVNEEEIWLRSGGVGANSRLEDAEGSELAEERIAAARRHAEDIRLGLVSPSPLSVIYRYERESSAGQSNAGNGQLPWTSPDAPSIAPLQCATLLAAFLAAAGLGMGVKWLLSRKAAEEDPEVEKRNRLMQMRKLRAQARRDESEREAAEREAADGNPAVVDEDIRSVYEDKLVPEEQEEETQETQEDNGVVTSVAEGGHPRMSDQEFQRKVTQIRAMARRVRIHEQEKAEISAREQESDEEVGDEEGRAQRLKRLAADLDSVRRSGANDSESLDFAEEKLNKEKKKGVEGMENSPTSSKVDLGGSNGLGEKKSMASPLRPSSGRSTSKSAGQKPAGVRPRIILSAEEARARIAAKKAKLNATPSSSLSPGVEADGSSNSRELQSSAGSARPPGTDTPSLLNGNLVRGFESSALESQPSSTPESDGALRSGLSEGGAAGGDDRRQAGTVPPEQKTVGKKSNKLMDEVQKLGSDERNGDGASNMGGPQTGRKKLKDEEEEMEWMRDDVLREIVFKVQANEEAGREPFHNLNSEQETLFFKGLERKFEREGEKVKKWIQERVENIDYGLNGISVFDPPESYELKWKEGYERPSKSDLMNRFNEDRKRIIMESQGETYPSPPDMEETDDDEETPSFSSSSPPTSPSSSDIHAGTSPSSSPPITKSNEPTRGRTREIFSGDGEMKTVISSSGGAGQRSGFPHLSPTQSADNGEKGKENWNHTKRWAKDLERKYAMESDPATKAVMRELGQDLERWITEDEIEEASRLLEKGREGEEEYAKMHYERTKEKIKQQREMFGADAMLSKYSEYKEEAEEPELWWLGLPFLVCIGLQATIEGNPETGLYSVDVGGALEGVEGVPSVANHTVAFQDRGDAQNFCALINRQPERLGAEGAEIVPFDPKVLYRDAKSEGFKVTVIKKGQLKLSVDKSFEEVESNIVELGSAVYFTEMISNRVVDLGAAVDEGLGFGQRP